MTNAAATYAANAASIESKLDIIQNLLAEHARRAAADPKNWGFAGDLSNVDNLLTQVMQGLGGAANLEA